MREFGFVVLVLSRSDGTAEAPQRLRQLLRSFTDKLNLPDPDVAEANGDPNTSRKISAIP